MLVFVVGLSLGAVVCYAVGCYVVDKKNLRRFPAPSIAAFTPLWLMYHNWLGRRYKAVDAAHRELGPVVRIAPNHISFTDPAAYKDIYGHGSPILKDEFYSHIAAGNPSMAQTTDKVEHTRKRKALAHIFSPREITAMEPRVLQTLEKLCRDLQIKSEGRLIAETDRYPTVDGAFDLRPWLNMFSYDAITAMFWSNTYGLLDQGNDVVPSMTPSGHIKHVHAMDSFHSGAGFNILVAHLPKAWNRLAKILLTYTHGKQAAQDFGNMARYQVVQRLQEPLEKPDLFSRLPVRPSAKCPTPMPLHEVVAESTTMLDAGNDTTQTSLTNCMYQLASNPEKQTKLYDALVISLSLRDASKPLVSYSELHNVPYLRACLDESFRCKPPVAFGLPRRIVSPGATVAGLFIEPDTTVSVPLYALHRNESLFQDALRFVPERWLEDDNELREGWMTDRQERRNLKDFVLPFSLGGRACIGRNLAYMELSIVIAALVLGFEWELAVPGSELETIERFNCNPKELFVRARVRPGVNWLK
jgi:benzoate 4-monooxygenase